MSPPMKKKPGSAPLPSPVPPAPARDAGPVGVALLIIAVVTIAVYATSVRNELTNWDDDRYVLQNPLLGDLSATTLSKTFST